MAFQWESDSDSDLVSNLSNVTFDDDSIGPDSQSMGSDTDHDIDVHHDQPVRWSETLGHIDIAPFTEMFGPTVVMSADKREIDFFSLFSPDTVITDIVRETNHRARFDANWTDTTAEEVKCFIGLHVVWSVLPIPSYDMAWTNNWLFAVSGAQRVMSKNRFDQLLKYFYCCNTEHNPARGATGHDKLGQVRSVYDTVLETCRTNYAPTCEQTVDEGMIKYKGRLSFKQYLPAKTTKFGIKVWMRANPYNGYVHQYKIYFGREASTNVSNVGLPVQVVRDLTQDLQGKNHHVYMDNYFASPELFDHLLDDYIYACGTVRSHRRGFPDRLKSKKLLKERGTSKIMQKGTLAAAAWRDKRTVNFIATNVEDPSAVTTTKRRLKNGTQQEFSCPVIAKNYSTFMGGVDKADQLRSHYSTARKSRRWWRYVFWFLFDVALINSFILMKESANHTILTRSGRRRQRSQLEFRMALAEQFIGIMRYNRKRLAQLASPEDGHWPLKIEKSRNCKLCFKEGIRRQVTILCEVCKVPLCIDRGCFKSFQTSRHYYEEE